MPRFFFNTADGYCVRDPDGDELPSLEHAQAIAVQIQAEMLPMRQSSLLPAGEFGVFVTDAAGAVLWSIRTITGN